MKDFQLTEHFKFSEMCVSSCVLSNVPTDPKIIVNLYKLALVLEKIRSYLRQPILINSAYRSPALNSLVGGVKNSDHLIGLAADIQCKLPASELFQKLKDMSANPFEFSFGQVILYPRFVHVSINQDKHVNQFILKS